MTAANAQRRRFIRLSGLGLLLAGLARHPGLAQAHGAKAGDVVVRHPYAPPTPPGATTAAVYFRGLRNRGGAPDRLLSAETPAAERVELHEMWLDGAVMRMRAHPAIDLPAGAELPARHGQRWHLMLQGLKAPLKLGDRLPLRLRFERAGIVEVSVWVQALRGDADAEGHDH
jgi:copper(I)-binding protein